jgi:formylmethanofuran dehydrogenase subunit B
MKDTVCCGCSVVCDDVAVKLVKKNFQSLGLCGLGHEYFSAVASKNRIRRAQINIEKRKYVPLEQALEKAASILSKSKRPLFYGWSNSVNEAIRVGLKLAKKLNGVFDSTANFEYGTLLEHGLTGGEATRTNLDEIRNNAEHIVYWGVNPAESHHRHASRYTVFPKGEKVPEGRESRTVSVIDIRQSESMRLANHQLVLDYRKADSPLFSALLTELQKKGVTPPESISGIRAIEFLSFAKSLRDADYIAIFYGNGLIQTSHQDDSLKSLHKLVSLLNRQNRFCTSMPMVAYCNTIGAVLTAQKTTGFPFAIDFKNSPPSHSPKLMREITEETFDCAVIVGFDALSFLPGPIIRSLTRIPIIALSALPTLTSYHAQVVLPTAITGAESSGTVHRMDGTAVKLNPFVSPPTNIHSETEILQQLLNRLK